MEMGGGSWGAITQFKMDDACSLCNVIENF
jgi:hypothetical protein